MNAPAPSRFPLTNEEKATPLWRRLEAYLNGRLQELRESNDGMRLEPDRCQLVGRIAEVKFLLSFGKDGAGTIPVLDMSRLGIPDTAR